MEIGRFQSKLFKLPPAVELCLCLIKQHLKSEKILRPLSDAGFEFEGADLSTLIIELIGFENPSDDLYDRYFKLLEYHAGQLQNENLNEVAFRFYIDLEICRRKAVDQSCGKG